MISYFPGKITPHSGNKKLDSGTEKNQIPNVMKITVFWLNGGLIGRPHATGRRNRNENITAKVNKAQN